MEKISNHPDWMYELYSSTLQEYRKELLNHYKEKPVQEREITPLDFKWKEDPYSYWLEQNGLL